jgi:hypothetical protein
MLINPGDLIPVQAAATAIPWSHRRSQILNLLHRGPVCFTTLVYDTNVGDISPVSTYFNPERISEAELNTRFGHCPSSGLVAPLNTAESRGGVQPRLLLYPRHNQPNLNETTNHNLQNPHNMKAVANHNSNDNHNQVVANNARNQMKQFPEHNLNRNQVTKQRTLKWVLAQEMAGNRQPLQQQQPIGHHLGNRPTGLEGSDDPTPLSNIHSNHPSTLSMPPSRLAYIPTTVQGQPFNPAKTAPSTMESALDNIWYGVEKNSIQDRPASSFGRPGSSLDTVSNMDLASSGIERVPSSLEIGSSNPDRGSSSSLDEDLLPTENFAWLSEFCSTDELEKLDVDKRWTAWDRSPQENKLTAW